MNVITKLALSRIRTRKARSFVICAAIFLTAVLFMTVVSISANIIDSYTQIMFLDWGTDYHSYLLTDAFTLTPKELRDKVAESKYVKEAVLVCADNGIYTVENEDILEHFFTEIESGEFPGSADEVLVNPEYYPDTEIGDTVLLEDGRQVTVSGILASRSGRPVKAVFGGIPAASGKTAVYIMMKNSLNLQEKYDSLIDGRYWDSIPEHLGAVSPAYLTTVMQAFNPANVFLMLFSAAVVFLCSFLLIYNVYSIALTQDMQSMGLLSVIGTTHKQLRQLIRTESTILYGISIPAGLIAGYLIGWKILSPLMFVSALAEGELKFRFTPWIAVLTVILTLGTLLWSADRPLRKLKKLTPIATVDYNPSADLPKRYVRRKNYSKKHAVPDPVKLAKYSISRNRKKTVITALSMAMSVILFVLIATLCDYMLAYTESQISMTDYIVQPEKTYRYVNPVQDNTILPPDEYTMSVRIDEGRGLTEEFIASVENLPGVDKVWRIRSSVVDIPTPVRTVSQLRELKDMVASYEWSDTLQEAMEGRVSCAVVSSPDEFFRHLRYDDDTTIGEGYEEGWIVYEDFQPTFSYFTEEDTVKLNVGEYRVKVPGRLPAYRITGFLNKMSSRAVLFLPESAFLKEFGKGMTTLLLLDAVDYDTVRLSLEELCDSITLTVDEEYYETARIQYREQFGFEEETVGVSASVRGRYDNLEDMKRTVVSLQTVGYSLAAMIFLIGALNIVNTALSSATERKREFAMLEAVGMTDRQMMRMLLTESLYSGGAAVLITVGIGFPLIAVFVNTAMDALVSLNWLSGVIMLAVCIAVSILSGLAVFKLTKSSVVVERIKVE